MLRMVEQHPDPGDLHAVTLASSPFYHSRLIGAPAAGRPGSTSLSVISPAPGLRADPPSLTAI
jgi:hypothetical protein